MLCHRLMEFWGGVANHSEIGVVDSSNKDDICQFIPTKCCWSSANETWQLNKDVLHLFIDIPIYSQTLRKTSSLNLTVPRKNLSCCGIKHLVHTTGNERVLPFWGIDFVHKFKMASSRSCQMSHDCDKLKNEIKFTAQQLPLRRHGNDLLTKYHAAIARTPKT